MSRDLPGSASEPPPSGSFASYAESFARQWRLRGDPDAWRASVKRREVRAFVRWAERKGLVPREVSDVHISEFLACSPPASGARLARRRAALVRFLDHLRLLGVASSPEQATDASPEAVVLRRYAHHLRSDRGLSDRSVTVYLPYVRRFVSDVVARADVDLDSEGLRSWFLDSVRERPAAYAHLLASALRSFLRFLFLRGATATDLSRAIPRVLRWRQAGIHAFLSPREVDLVLRSTDRRSPTGRRDYAILLLLARLGLRGGEVARLEIGDVRWREGEVVVRGKGGLVRTLPLPLDAGRALARYVRRDRPPSTSRRVFLRRIPPFVGLSGPATIGHIVRYALMRAGVKDPSRRGASHLFRHGLATRMVRQGATIPEIAEVLGHRDLATTQIYAKVDFKTLRGVALPWPKGGAR